MVRISMDECTRAKPLHKTTPMVVAQAVAISSSGIATTTRLLDATISLNTRRTTTMVAAVEEGRDLHKQEPQEPEEPGAQEAHLSLLGTGTTLRQMMLAIPSLAVDRSARPRPQQKPARTTARDLLVG